MPKPIVLLGTMAGGHILLQGGVVRLVAGSAAVTFDEAFGTAEPHIQLTPRLSTSASGSVLEPPIVKPGSLSKTGFTIRDGGKRSTTWTIGVLAIGPRGRKQL